MNAPTPEQCEGYRELASDGVRVRAGFRVVTAEPIAGEPIELAFFVESLGAHPLRLAVSGDRMAQRPGQFSFAAMFLGSPLEDPMIGAPDMGGPAGVVEVSSSSPWRQPLILNQFVRLEDTPGRLVPGAIGRLDLACRRPIALSVTDEGALLRKGEVVLAVDLAFDLRRDDAALAATAARLLNLVMQGPLTSREESLALLFSMRACAHNQIEVLTRHPDPSMADRARQCIATL